MVHKFVLVGFFFKTKSRRDTKIGGLQWTWSFILVVEVMPEIRVYNVDCIVDVRWRYHGNTSVHGKRVSVTANRLCSLRLFYRVDQRVLADFFSVENGSVSFQTAVSELYRSAQLLQLFFLSGFPSSQTIMVDHEAPAVQCYQIFVTRVFRSVFTKGKVVGWGRSVGDRSRPNFPCRVSGVNGGHGSRSAPLAVPLLR